MIENGDIKIKRNQTWAAMHESQEPNNKRAEHNSQAHASVTVCPQFSWRAYLELKLHSQGVNTRLSHEKNLN